MNKIYWIFVVAIAALAIFYTEKCFSHTTTIFAPSGTVTVCQIYQGVVVCV